MTNSGMAENERPAIVIALVGRLARSEGPAITPPRIESGTQRTKATNASLNELTSAGPRRSHAGTCFVSDVPRSPWRSPPAQSDVLHDDRPVRPELLVERVDGLLRRERPEHGPPDVAREDVETAKTITLSRNSVMSASPMRLRRKRVTSAGRRYGAGGGRRGAARPLVAFVGQADLRQPDVREALGDVVLDLRGARRHVADEVVGDRPACRGGGGRPSASSPCAGPRRSAAARYVLASASNSGFL